MNNCLLCLEENTFGNCIRSTSRQWLQLNILNIIEKYFWPIENLHPNAGICHECWQQLYDFHIFHKNIEEAHERNLKFARQRLQNTSFHHFVEVYNYKEERNVETENDMSQKYRFPLPFEIDPNNSFFNEINIKDEFVEDISPNEEDEGQSYYSIGNNNTVKIENVMKKPKRKRGRPRKILSLNEMHLKPKGKRGRPRKIADNNDINRKQKSGKRGRPRKKIKIDIVKKGKRGRPRKIQLTEHIDSVINISEAKVPANLEQPVVQKPIKLLENLSLSEQNNNNKVLVKKTKGKGFMYKQHMDKVKKRKRLQQHKALMRNYIATSVRCMSFIKK